MTKINDADDGYQYFVAIPGRSVNAYFGPRAVPLYRMSADGAIEVPVDGDLRQRWRRSVLMYSVRDLGRKGYERMPSFAVAVARADQLHGEQYGDWRLKGVTSDSN